MANQAFRKVDNASEKRPIRRPSPRQTTTPDDLPIFEGVVIRPIQLLTDERGWLGEIFRHDELPADLHPAMAYVSVTNPGTVRGPHEHVQQTDLFAFVGPGEFELTMWDARPDSATYGEKANHFFGQSNPCCVVIPPGVVHAYKNISDIPSMVFNAPNRLYAGEGKSHPVDEIRHENIASSPYCVE